MKIEKWTPVECYSMTSKVANYAWTAAWIHEATTRNPLFFVAASVSAIAETILTALVFLLDTVRGVYTLPKKMIVKANNALVDRINEPAYLIQAAAARSITRMAMQTFVFVFTFCSTLIVFDHMKKIK